MKILMVDSLIGNDYAVALCTGLANVGVNVQLVVPKGRKVDINVPFPVLHLGPEKDPNINKIKKIAQYINYLWSLLLLIKSSKVQVVHFQFFRLEGIESVFLCLLRMLRVKIIHTAHNVLPHEKKKADFIFKQIIYWATKGIIVHSKYIQEKLHNTFHVNRKKSYIIPHGNFDIYLPSEKISQEEARSKFSLSPQDHVLLFFGYIRPYKGLYLLLDAFELAACQNKNLKLIIAGAPQNDALENEYNNKISQLKTKDNILFHAHFIPFAEVATYFCAADIVILPYRNIDHSGIVHLAYSFGKPIIASSVGDFPEAIEHGKSGYIFTEYEASSLASTIASAFTDRESLRRLGKMAKALSDNKYSWQNVAQATVQVYELL